MLRFDKATYLSLLFKFILSERLSNSLWGSDVLLFSEFINIVSILFYNFIEFIILLYTFLVTSFSEYKEYMISQVIDTKSILFVWFHLVSFQMYYLLLLVPELLVIFEAFVKKLIFFETTSMFCLVFIFRQQKRIISEKINNFFLKSKKFWTFFISLIWFSVFDFVFFFFYFAQIWFKITLIFYYFCGFILPSLKFINKSIRFW